MRIRKILLWGGLLVWIVSVWVCLFAGTTAPTGKNVSLDISGIYTFSQKDSQGDVRVGYPFVDAMFLTEGAEIQVSQESNNKITITYQYKNGYWKTNTILISATNVFSWKNNRLTYFKKTWEFGGIFPGAGMLIDDSRMRINERGDLEIQHWQTQKGLCLFVIPFTDTASSTLVLRRLRSASPEGKPSATPDQPSR